MVYAATTANTSRQRTPVGEFSFHHLDARFFAGYETPSLIGEGHIGALEEQGWSEREIWEITALASFFNFSGRLEAAAGLPPDEVPAGADFAEGRASTK